MIAVATELNLSNIWKLPAFIKHSVRSVNQAIKAEGNLLTKPTGGLMQGRTLTVWKSLEEMKAYRNTGNHKEAMRYMSKISKSYKTVVWECDTIPEWKVAKEKLEKAELVLL